MAHILVADDEQLVRQALKIMLERGGHSVLTAKDGNEALALLHKHAVDLMVLDVIMPGKEGIETMIEARQRRPGMKVVVISGGGRTGNFDYLEIARRLGAAVTLRKPFAQKTLLEAVDSLLETSPQGRETGE